MSPVLYAMLTVYEHCIFCNSCFSSPTPFAVVVGFAEEEYSFLDINGGVKIPVLRHGNLSIETSFYCLLQNISLSNSSSATAGEDYTTNIKRLHVLTFHSGQNTSYCSLHIADDTLRGGTQVLRIALVPVTDHIEHYVRFDSRSAIIREIGEYTVLSLTSTYFSL